jgi:hypothetical protein
MSCPILLYISDCSQGGVLHYITSLLRERERLKSWNVTKVIEVLRTKKCMSIAKRVQWIEWKETWDMTYWHWWKGCILSLQKTSHCSLPLFITHQEIFIFFIFCWFSPPVESGSRVSSDMKWFQPPPDRSCGRSNRDPPYQV